MIDGGGSKIGAISCVFSLIVEAALYASDIRNDHPPWVAISSCRHWFHAGKKGVGFDWILSKTNCGIGGISIA